MIEFEASLPPIASQLDEEIAPVGKWKFKNVILGVPSTCMVSGWKAKWLVKWLARWGIIHL